MINIDELREDENNSIYEGVLQVELKWKKFESNLDRLDEYFSKKKWFWEVDDYFLMG